MYFYNSESWENLSNHARNPETILKAGIFVNMKNFLSVCKKSKKTTWEKYLQHIAHIFLIYKSNKCPIEKKCSKELNKKLIRGENTQT